MQKQNVPNFDYRRMGIFHLTRTVFQYRGKMKKCPWNLIPMTSQMIEKEVVTPWVLREVEELEVTQ